MQAGPCAQPSEVLVLVWVRFFVKIQSLQHEQGKPRDNEDSVGELGGITFGLLLHFEHRGKRGVFSKRRQAVNLVQMKLADDFGASFLRGLELQHVRAEVWQHLDDAVEWEVLLLSVGADDFAVQVPAVRQLKKFVGGEGPGDAVDLWVGIGKFGTQHNLKLVVD